MIFCSMFKNVKTTDSITKLPVQIIECNSNERASGVIESRSLNSDECNVFVPLRGRFHGVHLAFNLLTNDYLF